ncbi:unnamed protein product [Mytilus edulis]|uniref:Dynamin N-terminal domain-containing protein n=1 Tax=Mytilus edulis TaxID=6550 RepID=A0A8S3U436_MYTED|nr:unnamed protein product [Mytilus edulis]
MCFMNKEISLCETSSGKSGFINLLIGSNVLPVSTLTCTSTIIKLHDSSKKEIFITKENGEKKHIEFDSDVESSTMQIEVKKYVSLKGAVLNCKCVDIYLPIPMLKGHTIIVDTPGIGSSHNPELTTRLFEYLPRAVAFIYVIDSSRSGGIEKDRLNCEDNLHCCYKSRLPIKLQYYFTPPDTESEAGVITWTLLAIFEEQRNWKQSGKLVEFDGSKVIFVCNKWDIVVEEEDDVDVFTYINEKLCENWPSFHKNQLFKLSVKQERELAKHGKSSEDYQKLLHGIGKMVPGSLEAKVVMNIRKQCHKKYREDRCKQLSKTVSLHLNNPKTMKRIFQWSAEQLDCHSLSFVEIKYLRMKMISSRIERELKDFWEREQIKKLSSDFEQFLLEQLLLFDEQSREVRRQIRNIRNHRVSSFELNVSPGFSLLGMIAYGVLSIFSAPLWLPFSLIATKPSCNPIEVAIRSENMIRMAEYKSRPSFLCWNGAKKSCIWITLKIKFISDLNTNTFRVFGKSSTCVWKNRSTTDKG